MNLCELCNGKHQDLYNKYREKVEKESHVDDLAITARIINGITDPEKGKHYLGMNLNKNDLVVSTEELPTNIIKKRTVTKKGGFFGDKNIGTFMICDACNSFLNNTTFHGSEKLIPEREKYKTSAGLKDGSFFAVLKKAYDHEALGTIVFVKEEAEMFFNDKDKWGDCEIVWVDGKAKTKDDLLDEESDQIIENLQEDDSTDVSSKDEDEVDVEDELNKYKNLLDKGLISKEDYNLKKKDLLGL
jgi:hypothetical protein